MFSLPNSPAVTEWFQRLEAAWQRMPADEQTRQREEVQQHLAGLVAAKVAQGQPSEDAWNAALKQFGDPTQIGRKMYQEWCQNKTGFRADVSAIAFGTCWITSTLFAGNYYRFFDGYQTNHHQLYHHPLVPIILTCVGWLISVAIGLKYPLQAIKSSLYSQYFVFCCFWTYLCISAPIDIPRSMAVILPGFALGVIAHATTAYLASVTKRGWYWPSWADFKIALPKRRRQVG